MPAEFVAGLKRRPGAFNVGSSGNCGATDVPMEMLKASAGFAMVHIPCAGARPAVLALLDGPVDALASGPATVVQHIRAGSLLAYLDAPEFQVYWSTDAKVMTEAVRRIGKVD
jgi:tripartite-type tricarboxylate transporter receptor subunit TctC